MHKNHFIVKKCGLLSSELKKIVPDNITSIFQEGGGVTQPLIFYPWHKNFSWSALTITKLIGFYSQGFLTFCLPLFSIEMDQNVNS